MKPLRDYQERAVQTFREQLLDTGVITIPILADAGKSSHPHSADAPALAPVVERKAYHAPVLRSLGKMAAMTHASAPPPHRPPRH